MVGIVLVCAAAGVLTRLPQMATVIIAIYVTIQILYNVRLKAEPIADVFCLSSGFVLRAAIGAAAMNVAITYWLLYCTFCLALMLGFGKRRGELLTLGDQANSIRASLGEYTPKFLDFAMLISATAALLGYGVYCIESPTAQKHPLLVVTFLWVGYAVFRYLHVVLQSSEGGEPEVLFLEDRPLQLAVLLFIVTTGIAMFAGAAA
jgi:4-hydroxybenzoate polyprenyltransferase